MHRDIENLLKEIENLEKKISYCFKYKENLTLALTHSSFANENKSEGMGNNERLEFLGDSVLNLVISERIYKEHPELKEGEMTKTRANIVCEGSLAKCSSNLDLGAYILLGKGEEMTGGRDRASILSDMFEALIGAIYIDGGIKNARKFINKVMSKIIEESMDENNLKDYKTQLQEIVQRNSGSTISYEIVAEKGPDHDKHFITRVRISGRASGTGEGRSKKESEQNAAKEALKKVR